MASKTRARPDYVCTECGNEVVKWVGRCPECQAWGTVVERGTKQGVQFRAEPLTPTTKARPITDTPPREARHWPTTIGEFDRVLGGGIVPGAAILLSGEPGVGKSTLLIETASKVAATGAKVLYVSAEESVNQVRLRAERTNALHPTLYLAAESDLSTILGHVDEVEPALLIVDSVQTVASAEIDSLAGQPSQVREVASALVRLAKSRELPVIIVGHVTKDGQVAGPRLLEHLVDVVAHIEGDRQTALRFVRTLKNRFGPTDEIGCFEMQGDGMREVPDPSALFVSTREEPEAGTCVTIALEGRRALPVEIQALVASTHSPNPRRVVNGVESSRVAMLLAVLERRCEIPFVDYDVYVSTVGGVKLTEPASDLAIAIALASAHRKVPIDPRVAVFGEVSLVGEIRKVVSESQRVSEAKRLGFNQPIGSDAQKLSDAIASLGIEPPKK
ncbi:DNA repair protein RadA [Gulosibacter macacae]|uniref:DNA repair protein RadA n=1 Tax=Gulosibacter macacae TaxID=2488791 RepID=A0A3P3VZQ7_9MICO|nr:DNA repair protein RadA [Gulosibacter macacae]RRJ88210.1 DNA repair protein RadA [Gulosibacter macacae]